MELADLPIDGIHVAFMDLPPADPEGDWLRVVAVLREPDPHQLMQRPLFESLRVLDIGGRQVQIGQDELARVKHRFESRFLRWRYRATDRA